MATVDVTYTVEGAEEFKAAMQRLDSAMTQKVQQQLHEWTQKVKASAGRRVPVRTGHLRRSIYAKVFDWVAEAGADVAYAAAVEFGTRYMRARPFLFPAVQEYLPQLETVICQAIEAAKREAGL
ncbi:MAG: HK97 gp10 family phage protein [Candidatus Bathyarchaeota archaeon]|nr:HK97 gp10 family phage protein [Candidatus Bathyarchaeota archaeon]